MSLTLRPNIFTTPNRSDFHVFSGEARVGRILRLEDASKDWSWTLDLVPSPDAHSGRAPTRHAALKNLTESWNQWLDFMGLQPCLETSRG
jgi:hypothetical protein